MIHILNDSPRRFYEDISDKKLFLYGAGRRAANICEAYHIEEQVEAIIDSNSKLYESVLRCKNSVIPITSIDYLKERVVQEGIEKSVLLITPMLCCWSIVEQLDRISALENLRCYIGILLDDYCEKTEYDYSDGDILIPKKIHYCWFGRSKIPGHLQQYIDTWKEKCPDYEIIRWDESNYDISQNQYMLEAYECKKWGFVPDYARLDIIYNEGGIYLDTDVELISSLDPLLTDEMFCGFMSYELIGLGLGFGAVPHNEFVKELRDEYNDRSFYNADGSENLTTCSWYQHPVFTKHGFKINNTYQKREGVVVYPSEVFAPRGISGFAENFSDKTVSIHHTWLSWTSEREKEEYERTKIYLRKRITEYAKA